MQSILLNRTCRVIAFCVIVLAAIISSRGADDSVYAPLWLYQGNWIASAKDLALGASPDQLTDDCALVGQYFTCQQTVNGKVGALLVFVPAETPGHYFTNAIVPQGYAGGRGELEISGDRWTYSSKSVDGDKTTYHRTLNIFTGKDHIHYEQGESVDGINWTVTGSGDEVRAAGNTKSKH
jgi:hypothetical protein